MAEFSAVDATHGFLRTATGHRASVDPGANGRRQHAAHGRRRLGRGRPGFAGRGLCRAAGHPRAGGECTRADGSPVRAQPVRVARRCRAGHGSRGARPRAARCADGTRRVGCARQLAGALVAALLRPVRRVVRSATGGAQLRVRPARAGADAGTEASRHLRDRHRHHGGGGAPGPSVVRMRCACRVPKQAATVVASCMRARHR